VWTPVAWIERATTDEAARYHDDEAHLTAATFVLSIAFAGDTATHNDSSAAATLRQLMSRTVTQAPALFVGPPSPERSPTSPVASRESCLRRRRS